ncbi:MAG: lipid carrier--UDP-N-acetylgalactosaminyltransferase [Butyrivibrio sp.]|nr:lipid carrier--UDP-N-acetylgalactosaminyltransferase [Butyrivibrio sp.]
MEKLLLVGAGGFGRVVLEHASQIYDCAFVDDGDAKVVDDVPVIGRLSDIEKLFGQYKLLLVTIGNNKLREDIYKRAKTLGYTFPNIIVPSAYISKRARLGNGVIILNNAIVQNNAVIGDGCILNAGAEAHQDSFIGDYCLIYTNSVIRSLAHVGNRVLVGSTATVSTSAAVPDDAVIEDSTAYKS